MVLESPVSAIPSSRLEPPGACKGSRTVSLGELACQGLYSRPRGPEGRPQSLLAGWA